MSRPVFPDFDFSSTPDKNAHDFSVSVDGISVAETIGERDSQQDTIFVAKVKNEGARLNPKAFYEREVAATVDRHRACTSGTTLCSAIVTPPSEEDVKADRTFPKITVANLGDSRAAIVAKTKDGRYISIILTEDHDLNVPRIRDHVERSGGSVAPIPEDPAKTPRVVYHSPSGAYPTLNMGAAIGDCGALGADGRHVLMTAPDIFEYDLNAFPFVTVDPDGNRVEVLPKDKIQELDLIISCDGLYDVEGSRKLSADFKAQKMDRGIAFCQDKVEGAEGLSEIKKGFDEESTGEFSFAAALQDFALSEGSRDNISIACVNLVSAGENRITEALMMTVCDGHGRTEFKKTAGNIAPNFTGEEVSASVASMMYLAAEAEHIPGLEMPQGHFHDFLATASSAEIGVGVGGGGGGGADSPPVIRAGGGGRRERFKGFWYGAGKESEDGLLELLDAAKKAPAQSPSDVVAEALAAAAEKSPYTHSS